jgi:hypothetical protein
MSGVEGASMQAEGRSMDRSLDQVNEERLDTRSQTPGSTFLGEHSGAVCDAINAVSPVAWARAGMAQVENSPRDDFPRESSPRKPACQIGVMPIRPLT